MQLALALDKERKTQRQAEVDAVRFSDTLNAMGHWASAGYFDDEWGWTPRYVRLLKSLTSGEIISGNKGYKHVAHATEEEWQEYWRKEQASIKERSEQLQKSYAYYHRIHGRERE